LHTWLMFNRFSGLLENQDFEEFLDMSTTT
jgi:hypothetical protein